MTEITSPLVQFSDALADLVAGSSARVCAVLLRHGRHVTAIRWRDDLAIVSEQGLPKRDRFPFIFQEHEGEAEVVGRDEATNIALLRLTAGAGEAATPVAAIARTGALAVALGTRRDGAVTARMGVVNQVGAAWQSSHGGRIDAYVRLDLELSAAEEGGPALDAQGGIIGMTTFGPRGQVLVIPHATIERVVPVLLTEGKLARGWLGAGLQPVAVPELPKESGIKGERGLMIMSVAAGSPAAVGGLLAGDILLTVEGDEVGHMSRLVACLGPESIGSELVLGVLRGGNVVNLAVKIVERPAE